MAGEYRATEHAALHQNTNIVRSQPHDQPRNRDRELGWINKFTVIRNDGKSEPGQKHEGCEYFVLDLSHDPFAAPALRSYAAACKKTYPHLAADIMEKVNNEDLQGITGELIGYANHCMHTGQEQVADLIYRALPYIEAEGVVIDKDALAALLDSRSAINQMVGVSDENDSYYQAANNALEAK